MKTRVEERQSFVWVTWVCMRRTRWTVGARIESFGAARGRDLPAVNAVLSSATASALLERFGRTASANSIRAVLDDARGAIRRGAPSILNAEEVALQALLRLDGED